MTHPSDNDLDELESALAGPDLDDLDDNSEKYLRAVRAMRFHNSSLQEQALTSDEQFDAHAELDRLEQDLERFKHRLGDKT